MALQPGTPAWSWTEPHQTLYFLGIPALFWARVQRQEREKDLGMCPHNTSSPTGGVLPQLRARADQNTEELHFWAIHHITVNAKHSGSRTEWNGIGKYRS